MQVFSYIVLTANKSAKGIRRAAIMLEHFLLMWSKVRVLVAILVWSCHVFIDGSFARHAIEH